MSYQIKELLLDHGDSPFAEWFGSLEAVAAAKVRVAVTLTVIAGQAATPYHETFEGAVCSPAKVRGTRGGA
jgi:hypothetical protein